MNGKDITFDANGKPANGYLALPAHSDAPGVIVLHAWWGLNSIFKDLCDRLGSEGFAAFAPDVNSGRIAKTIDEAKQIMSESDDQRKFEIVTAALDFLRNQPGVKKEPFSIIGFSMGGSWALVLAGERPQDVRKIVTFYGAGETDYNKIKMDVLGHFAENDEWEEEKYINAMHDGMKAAGWNANFNVYPNTSHWFFENDRPEYDPQASDLAWKRTLEFLRK